MDQWYLDGDEGYVLTVYSTSEIFVLDGPIRDDLYYNKSGGNKS